MDTRCSAPNKAGEPCSAAHYRDGFCRWHHPDLEAERQAARIAGGKAKRNTARARKKLLMSAMTLSDVDAALCGALQDVLDGTLEPGVGTAAAGIARAITSVRQTGELEQRIARLEEQAGKNQGRLA